MPSPSQSQGNGFILLPSGSLHVRGHVLVSSVGTELWSAFILPVKPPYDPTHSTSQNLRASLETEAFGSCSLIPVTPPTHTHTVDT